MYYLIFNDKQTQFHLNVRIILCKYLIFKALVSSVASAMVISSVPIVGLNYFYYPLNNNNNNNKNIYCHKKKHTIL